MINKKKYMYILLYFFTIYSLFFRLTLANIYFLKSHFTCKSIYKYFYFFAKISNLISITISSTLYIIFNEMKNKHMDYRCQ